MCDTGPDLVRTFEAVTSNPRFSRIVLAGLLALFLAAELAPAPAVRHLTASDPSDDQLFDAVITRIRAGEPYYAVMGAELRARHYPTASPFNWRTPALFELMAATPTWLPGVLLAALGLIVLVMTFRLVDTLTAIEATPLALIAQIGAWRFMLSPASRVQPEVWCGALIGLSALVYARYSWIGGITLAALALFARELAAPYCLVCVVVAARERRAGEMIAWAGIAAAFAGFFAWHLLHVRAQHLPSDAAPLESWIQFGGIPFVADTIQKTNAMLPQGIRWPSAIATLLIAAAVWAPALPPHVRGIVIAYVLLYAVAGKAFNHYWGFVTAPTYALALSVRPQRPPHAGARRQPSAHTILNAAGRSPVHASTGAGSNLSPSDARMAR